jgi:TRAP-type transport system periplasmic protein
MKLLGKAVWVVFLILVGVMGFMFVVASQTAAQTTPPIELKFASIWAPAHAFGVAEQHWIDKMEKETNGRVKIKAYWAGTLISPREGLLEATKGVADILSISPAYEKTGLDLVRAQAGFYQGASSEDAELKIFWQLWEKYPEIRRELQGVKLVGADVAAPLRLMTTKPVNSLADLKGMRIKAPQEVIQTLKEFGAEGVVVPMPEAYEALQKGIISGLFGALETYKSMRLAEVVKHETNLLSYMGTIPTHVMPLTSWNKLPADVQKVFDANSVWWGQETVREAAKMDNEGREAAKKAGVQLIQLPQSDIQKWNDTYSAEMLKKAKELDAKGLPGTKYYKDVRRLITELGGQK